MRRLLALDLPAGPAFVDSLRRAWDDGDAVLPLDPRLPAAARSSLIRSARAHTVIGPTGAETVVDRAAPPVGEDDALVIATSGSTGAPKAVVHTHASLTAHATAVNDRLSVDPAHDRWLACLPLAHIGGLGVVVRALLTSTPVDVLTTFDASAVGAAPARFASTLVSLVPTALDRTDASGFRWVVLGGAADPSERATNVVRTYGSTETGGGVLYDGIPLRGIEVRVEIDCGIALRGATLARGVRGSSGEVVTVTDADGWFRTGDLGRLEVIDGVEHLVVSGRRDDLIITGGQNVWPEAVEAVLRTHADLADVAVFGRDDPEWGQVVVAAVVVAADREAPSLDELRSLVRERLASYAAPKVLTVLDALPRSTLGKLQRGRLQ